MMDLAVDRLNFNSPTVLAGALADRVASELVLAIGERGHATLAVSGGRTPQLFFNCLSRADIPWDKVTITLVDERFVPVNDERSNEHLVRTHLLQNNAAKARFVGLYMKTITAELAAFSAASRVGGLKLPLDVVVLGMGNDGHTASLLPGGDRLKQAIDPACRAMVLPIHAKGVPEARLTMTLPVIINARFIALQIEGLAKLTTYEIAVQNGAETEMPLRAVLKHASHPVQVYWAPADGEPVEPMGSASFEEVILGEF